MGSKYEKYNDQIDELHNINPNRSFNSIAEQICIDNGIEFVKRPSRQLRDYIKKRLTGVPFELKREWIKVEQRYDKHGNESSTVEKLQPQPIAIPDDHEIIKISTNSQTGLQWIQTRPRTWDPEHDEIDFLQLLRDELDGYHPKLLFDLPRSAKRGVLVLSDFHFGAYISGLKSGIDFSITILCDMLDKAATEINRYGYEYVDVVLLGDLIESFTGLNHSNTWKGLDKGMFGIKAIKLFCELLSKHLLERIANLRSIKIVAGNHDRVTSDNKEDVEGGAAEAIEWGLSLMGYDVEFSSSVLTFVCDDISYILNHGHLALTKKLKTDEMCWKFGTKGLFNLILEGHLHSRIAKMSIAQISNIKMIQDDSVDSRRMICPSLFPGNTYSENLGYTTTPGFIIVENNGNGKPNVFDYSL